MVTIFQTWRVASLFTAVFLQETIWTDSILISRKPDGNIKTFNLLSEQTVEGRSSTLCRHTLPQAEPFIYQTLPHQGGCCYFRPPIMSFLFSKIFPEVGVCCRAAAAKTNTAPHTVGDWREQLCLLPGMEVLASTLTDRGAEGRRWGPSGASLS